jgi:multidrug resistance efflux pump
MKETMLRSRKVLFLALGILSVILIGSFLFASGFTMGPKSGNGESNPSYEGSKEAVPTAKVIHPRRDAVLTVTVKQLLSVEPLFQADLRAQVAGVVRRVPRSIGDHVSRDELLVDIDVPNLAADLQTKQAVIQQRQEEVAMAYAQLANARALKEIAECMVPIRKAEKSEAIETRELRRLRYQRYTIAANEGGINKNEVDEMRRDYNAGVFAVDVADASILMAEADVRQKESAVQVALSDIVKKQAAVEEARRERDLARAIWEFSRIRAPFEGVIKDRNVQPGQLVHNASATGPESLLKIDRVDVVTLVMKVPDDSAPFVTRGTEALIQIDQLPGVIIHGQVTRVAPSILNDDRTLRVEVDLYNGPPTAFWGFAARGVANWLAPLGATTPLQAALLSKVSQEAWSADARSVSDPFPMLPEIKGRDSGQVRLLPGMSGYMRLNLHEFKNVSLIPSQAVYTIGGTSYILLVEEVGQTQPGVGKTHQMPVRVLVNDGKLARVLVIVKEGDPLRGEPEEVRKLTTDEQIVLSRQIEIGDGQNLRVTLEKW